MPDNVTASSSVTYTDLVTALSSLGLKAGDGLMVHSSLSSFGHLEGGAETALAALMDVLTPQGTLLLPSFNHGAPFGPDGPQVYDPQKTPTTNGRIADTFWCMPGVWRSLNPTHPFAAWGRHAERYTALHHRTLVMGKDSPLGLLMQDGGYVLLMGVDYRSNTFHHLVEMTTAAPCLGLRSEAYPVRLPGGRLVQGRTWSWRERGCPLTGGNRYADLMAAQGLDQRILVGASRWTLYRMSSCYDLVAELLRTGRDEFPPCSRCPIRPRVNQWTVPSDWDPDRDALLPDSQALLY